MLIEAYPKRIPLKDGTSVMLRPLVEDDYDRFVSFLQSLDEGDHVFLRYDVRDPEQIRKWVEELDLKKVIILGAMDNGEMVSGGSLRVRSHEWTKHVGQIRLVTAKPHRRNGLGAFILRELVALAEERNLEKLQAHVIEDNVEGIKLGQLLGFEVVAVLEGMVKDRSCKHRNLAVMVNDVDNLTRIMEDWFQECTLPGYRAPGNGQ